MESFDLLTVGGGINGAAIARDAALRGAKVLLVEKDDLAAHTSSASSKLIHGGLRYLEYYEFRLVREALREREILLRTAPHIVRPLRFILPQAQRMRPHWMLRAGLHLYDFLARGGGLPRSSRVAPQDEALGPLKESPRALSYWDAWVDDSRLVVLNALHAAENGAEIATRTEFLSATRQGDVWRARLSGNREVTAKAIVNAAGPWVTDTLARLSETSTSRVRLIKGSHIVVPRLWEGHHAYILQQPDGRVVFAIPYLGAFTLIGTTDVPVEAPEDAQITTDEIAYLCEASNRYFTNRIAPADIVWSYAGVRSLHDDGAADAKAVTRDYHLELDADPGPRLLSVFGGKITTARALAEEALHKLGFKGPGATASTPLPGAETAPAAPEWLPESLRTRLTCAYGARINDVIGTATNLADLGPHHGAGLHEAELRYLIEKEWARTAEDVLWRRTKLGLFMSGEEQAALTARMASL